VGPVGEAVDEGEFMPLVAVEEVGESRYIIGRVVSNQPGKHIIFDLQCWNNLPDSYRLNRISHC
jgi:hypothetical protein